ncbi:hypothetical protein [Nocardia callitridis]|uniref:DUF485 domain-containing protein n=1 Tax=Nocardia callitridis TaxID=648753 RepID=A0ABP9KVP8_9NOCA
MTGPQRRPVRERVVLAQRRGARRVRTRVEVAEQTEIGVVLIDGLIRAQLGLALRMSLVIVVALGSLPLLFRIDAVASAAVFGIRLPWLLLGVVALVLLFVVGVVFVRLAQRNENDFLELTED